jgi:hypothetical protein
MLSITAHAEIDLNAFFESNDGADIVEKHHLAERLLAMQTRNGGSAARNSRKS